MSQLQDNSSDHDDVLDLRRIFDLILKKLWIPTTTTVLCIAAGIAYLKLAEPVYEAKATVEVLMNSRNVAGMEVQGGNLDSLEVMATTEANLKRTSLFQKVMEREEISNHSDLGLSADMKSLKRALKWSTGQP